MTPWLNQCREHIATLPRMLIGTFPTPVRCVDLPIGRMWIKDDSVCSRDYGGNKVRKLEFLLGQMTSHGIRRVTVWGDVESHTVAAVTRLASTAGFSVDAVVFPSRSPTSDVGKMCSLLQTSGATVHRTANMLSAWAHSHWLSRGGQAMLIPLGVSTPRADIGYVQAVIEFANQLADLALPLMERIYLPFGSGGTVAGLLVGLAVTGLPMRIVAVRTVDRAMTPRRAVVRRVRQIVREIGLPDEVTTKALQHLDRIENGFLGRGYRDMTPDARQAINIASAFGLRLEPVFTGKAFACLLNDLQSEPARGCLFWNTHDPRLDLPSVTQP